MIRQPIGTEEIHVSRQHGNRAFDVDLCLGLRSQTARNNIAMLDQVDLFWRNAPLPGEFPDDAVIERQLIETVATDSITSAVADMRDDGTHARQRQSRTRCSHPLKVAILSSAPLIARFAA